MVMKTISEHMENQLAAIQLLTCGAAVCSAFIKNKKVVVAGGLISSLYIRLSVQDTRHHCWLM